MWLGHTGIQTFLFPPTGILSLVPGDALDVSLSPPQRSHNLCQERTCDYKNRKTKRAKRCANALKDELSGAGEMFRDVVFPVMLPFPLPWVDNGEPKLFRDLGS